MNSDNAKGLDVLEDAVKNSLYPNLVLQLKKDFVLANIDFEISDEIVPAKLFQKLKEKVYYLIMEKFGEYLNLLYVVDVPERLFKQIQLTDVVEVADQVSGLILKREFQKVFLKKKYG